MKRKLNVKLLNRIIRHIDAEPRRLTMSQFAVNTATIVSGDVCDLEGKSCITHPFAKCGTAGCIAGWALMLSGIPVPDINVAPAAKSLLGIYDASKLFYVDHWPDAFAARYANAKTPRGKASATIARIRAFIAEHRKAGAPNA